MKCPKCKANIKDDSKFCIRCGEIFFDYLGDINNLDSYNDLMRIYTKDKKFGIFSFKYFLFSFIYAFSKKMYFLGICGFLSIIVTKFGVSFVMFAIDSAPKKLGVAYLFYVTPLFMACAGLYLYCCFKFNEKYIEKAYLYITNLIRDNKDEDYSFLRRKVEQKRRPNFIVIFLSIILFIWLIFIQNMI